MPAEVGEHPYHQSYVGVPERMLLPCSALAKNDELRVPAKPVGKKRKTDKTETKNAITTVERHLFMIVALLFPRFIFMSLRALQGRLMNFLNCKRIQSLTN